MKTWPADWDERKRGRGCEMCTPDRPDDNGFGLRIFAGDNMDAYLQRRDVGQRGYTIAIWRGRHVAEATELSDEEATTYFRDVLRVGRALDERFRPLKLNFEILGNTVPHLHTHILPRYRDDGSPGSPTRLMRGLIADESARLPEDEVVRDSAALRETLNS